MKEKKPEEEEEENRPATLCAFFLPHFYLTARDEKWCGMAGNAINNIALVLLPPPLPLRIVSGNWVMA